MSAETKCPNCGVAVHNAAIPVRFGPIERSVDCGPTLTASGPRAGQNHDCVAELKEQRDSLVVAGRDLVSRLQIVYVNGTVLWDDDLAEDQIAAAELLKSLVSESTQ